MLHGCGVEGDMRFAAMLHHTWKSCGTRGVIRCVRNGWLTMKPGPSILAWAHLPIPRRPHMVGISGIRGRLQRDVLSTRSKSSAKSNQPCHLCHSRSSSVPYLNTFRLPLAAASANPSISRSTTQTCSRKSIATCLFCSTSIEEPRLTEFEGQARRQQTIWRARSFSTACYTPTVSSSFTPSCTPMAPQWPSSTLVAYPAESQDPSYTSDIAETRYTVVLGIGGILVAVAALVVAVLQLRRTRATRMIYEMA